jgi:hypothetical protein
VHQLRATTDHYCMVLVLPGTQKHISDSPASVECSSTKCQVPVKLPGNDPRHDAPYHPGSSGLQLSGHSPSIPTCCRPWRHHAHNPRKAGTHFARQQLQQQRQFHDPSLEKDLGGCMAQHPSQTSSACTHRNRQCYSTGCPSIMQEVCNSMTGRSSKQ